MKKRYSIRVSLETHMVDEVESRRINRITAAVGTPVATWTTKVKAKGSTKLDQSQPATIRLWPVCHLREISQEITSHALATKRRSAIGYTITT